MKCAPAVVTAFKKFEGVVDASASFNKHTATVTYDPQKTDVDKIVAGALKGTKYGAAKQDEKDKKKSGT